MRTYRMRGISEKWLVAIERYSTLHTLGCVIAVDKEEAFRKGHKLLGFNITTAIPLSHIKEGWIYGFESEEI